MGGERTCVQTDEQPEREWVRVSDRARTKGNTKALNKAHSRDLINYCSALVEEHEDDVRTLRTPSVVALSMNVGGRWRRFGPNAGCALRANGGHTPVWRL
jgi:hypothetical protein